MKRFHPRHVGQLPFLITASLLSLALTGLASVAYGQEPPSPTPTPVPAPTPPPKPWYEEIAVNGFLSTSYSYNFNRPASGTNQFRVFDFDDNSIKVDVAELVLQKAVVETGRSGLPRRRRGRRLDPAGVGRGRALPRRQREGAGLRPPAGLRQLHRAGRERPAPRRREVRHASRLRGHRGLRRLQRQRDALVPASGTRSPSRTRA